jgi:hypothetical protein
LDSTKKNFCLFLKIGKNVMASCKFMVKATTKML